MRTLLFGALAVLALGPTVSRALTLGDLSAGASISSLDGSVRYSDFSYEPAGGSHIVDFASLPVVATQRGFRLDETTCYATGTLDSCLFNHFDGAYGPAVDDLFLEFTIEALAGELVGMGLAGTSELLTTDDYLGEPVYALGETEAVARLDLGQGQLLYDRSCPDESCAGIDPFDLHAEITGVTSLEAELFVRVSSAMYVDQSGECIEGGCWGSSSALSPLTISSDVAPMIPEPTASALLGVSVGRISWIIDHVR